MFREAAALLSGQSLGHDDAQVRALVERMGFAGAL